MSTQTPTQTGPKKHANQRKVEKNDQRNAGDQEKRNAGSDDQEIKRRGQIQEGDGQDHRGQHGTGPRKQPPVFEDQDQDQDETQSFPGGRDNTTSGSSLDDNTDDDDIGADEDSGGDVKGDRSASAGAR